MNQNYMHSPRTAQQQHRPAFEHEITIKQLQNQNQFLKMQLERLLQTNDAKLPLHPQKKLIKNDSTPAIQRHIHPSYQTSFHQNKDNAEETYRLKMEKLKIKKSPRNSLDHSNSVQLNSLTKPEFHQQIQNNQLFKGNPPTFFSTTPEKSFSKLQSVTVQHIRLHSNHNEDISPRRISNKNANIPSSSFEKQRFSALNHPNMFVLSNNQNKMEHHRKPMQLDLGEELIIPDPRVKLMIISKDKNGRYFRDKNIQQKLNSARHSSGSQQDQENSFHKGQVQSKFNNNAVSNDNSRIHEQNQPLKKVIKENSSTGVNSQRKKIIKTSNFQTIFKQNEKNIEKPKPPIRRSSELRGKVYFSPNQFQQINKQVKARNENKPLQNVIEVQSKNELKSTHKENNNKVENLSKIKAVRCSSRESAFESLLSIQYQMREYQRMGVKKLSYGAYLTDGEDKISQKD